MPPSTTKRRTTTNVKRKKKTELTENRTVWKSNNQGVKNQRGVGSRVGGMDGWDGGSSGGEMETTLLEQQ